MPLEQRGMKKEAQIPMYNICFWASFYSFQNMELSIEFALNFQNVIYGYSQAIQQNNAYINLILRLSCNLPNKPEDANYYYDPSKTTYISTTTRGVPVFIAT